MDPTAATQEGGGGTSPAKLKTTGGAERHDSRGPVVRVLVVYYPDSETRVLHTRPSKRARNWMDVENKRESAALLFGLHQITRLQSLVSPVPSHKQTTCVM